jgi:DinB superfamily
VDWKTPLWQQFGAAIDMLDNAICACPDVVWPECWYIAYHTLFFLDFNLSDSAEGFAPPAPFTLDELDPAGILPERAFTKDELLAYLAHGRRKCRAVIEALTEEQAGQRCGFDRLEVTRLELLLYSMRHVQHHTGQLNLILRQRIDSAPRWVAKATPTLR